MFAETNTFTINAASITMLQIGLISSAVVGIVYLIISFSIGKETVQKMLVKKPTLLTSVLLAGLTVFLYLGFLIYSQQDYIQNGSLGTYRESIALQGGILFVSVFLSSFILSTLALYLGFKFSKKGIDYKHVTD